MSKELVEKFLSSGLIDKAQTQMLEKMGMLPSGSVDKVQEQRLKDATQDMLNNVAEELASAIDTEHHVRETALDLRRLRWPAKINLYTDEMGTIVRGLNVMMDQMGKYFVRITDADSAWFAPGHVVEREISDEAKTSEMITEFGTLYIGEKPFCFHFTTKPV
jgi:hypothetical protein